MYQNIKIKSKNKTHKQNQNQTENENDNPFNPNFGFVGDKLEIETIKENLNQKVKNLLNQIGKHLSKKTAMMAQPKNNNIGHYIFYIIISIINNINGFSGEGRQLFIMEISGIEVDS